MHFVKDIYPVFSIFSIFLDFLRIAVSFSKLLKNEFRTIKNIFLDENYANQVF
jgi:hypothetical protein